MSTGSLSWPLAHACAMHGERTAALTAGGGRHSWREIGARVGALGAALGELGCERGARVGVLAHNSLEHLECWLAVPAHGRVLNDLNTRLALGELAFMVDDCATEVLFVDAAHLERGRELRERCASLRELVLIGGDERPPDCRAYADLLACAPAPFPELDGDELAIISYTGGTTGRPKGVMLSHANVLANSKHNQMLMAYAQDDVYLHSAPMFHIADACLTFSVTWAGGAHAFLPRFDPQGVSAAIAQHGVTLLVMVPTMIQAWLAQLEREPVELSGVRAMVYAGSPIGAELQARAIETLPFELWQGYGMTEASPSLSYLTAADHADGLRGGEAQRVRLRSSGRPIRGVQVRICGPGGEVLAPGAVGEIEARGPNVMLGYWRAPEATAAAFHDGWYRTGDAGYLDAGGYLFVVDRLKDMIISGGENVYSVEVERALLAHPDVLEAAVFGLPDERWGEAVSAVVTVREGAVADADALIAHCREHIAGYKIPRTIEIGTEPLPKSGAGKILKHELRASRARSCADAG